MNSNARGNLINLLTLFLVCVGFIVLVSAAAPDWDAGVSGVANYFNEGDFFTYNFSANVTDADSDPLTFQLTTGGADSPIIWSEDSSKTKDFFNWIFWNDTYDRETSTKGILSFNSTRDNETGMFNISVDVSDGSESAGARLFYFTINATNDAPNFINIQSEYNLTQDENFLDYLNATDEEEYYPLVFNITFFGNCTHASWSGRNEGENCTIIEAVNFTNISAIMNFTPDLNDVGTYWANITVMDFGNSSEYGCPHEYCTEETYNVNKTTLYSSIIKFNVFSILVVNISDCQNKIFQENESGACQINIITQGQTDSLNITSLAGLRDYTGGVSNESWFFSNSLTNAENFSKSITINFTPQKTEIGNWTINFTVQDITSGKNSTQQIYVYVNKSISLDDSPDLISIDDVNTSINLLTTISLTVYDSDLLIPHKDSNYGGYNETISFNVTILNASNPSQELNLTGFDVDILYMPVLSGDVPTNKTTAQIQFTPNLSEAGNYTINITITDFNNVTDTKTFNLTILSNSFPYWNDSLETVYSVVEGGNFYLNLSNYSIDPDGDTLIFSNLSTTSFPAFFLNTTTGEINISNIRDEDVGQHLVNITISDGYLTNTTILNFTVNNLNETPYIEPLQGIGVTPTTNIVSGSAVNTSEDLASTFILFVQDDDFKILEDQKSFYNESLTINLTIEGPNTNLFNFTFDQFMTTNRTKYLANFTPGKSDVGVYNISINITDISGLSDFISFNLTINETQHNPSLVDKDDLISSIEESILVDFNATDREDGNDSEGNLRFNITFISGDDFIDGNETIFNTTSGILNISFNPSFAGVYSLNVSVNDTTGRQDSFLWNLTVYDYPVILTPLSSFVYSMIENITYEMNFSVNHTVQDVLNYSLYINGILRNTASGNGNATDFLWDFTSNFSDETTCSGNISLTLNVSNAKFSNVSTWSLQINHSNGPLIFNGNIGGGDDTEIGGSSVVLDLSDFLASGYFSDADASDTCWNQTIGFVTSFLNGTSLGVSVINWTNLTDPSVVYSHPSSSGTVLGNYSLIAYEYNVSNSSQILSTVHANNYSVQLSITTVVVPSSSSRSSGRKVTKPISLKIIVPEPVSSRRKDRLVIPISLFNSGEVILNNIFLKASVSKNGLFRDDLIASFDKSVIDSLAIGEKKNLTLIVDANTEEYGLYEITLNATVEDPDYNDWAKIFINVEETDDILERILFTEEFIIGNPECVELTELVEEARSFLNAGAIDESYKKLDEALEACRIAIEQPPLVRMRRQFEKYLFNYIWMVSLFIFMAGFLYYSYRRRKLKRGLKEVSEVSMKEKFNNKKKFV
jgi:hypothetical protein